VNPRGYERILKIKYLNIEEIAFNAGRKYGVKTPTPFLRQSQVVALRLAQV
jgi:hypothetical protein